MSSGRAAGFASAAWGKLTGQPGICFVTRGPGQPMRLLACIQQCRIPALCFYLWVRSVLGIKNARLFRKLTTGPFLAQWQNGRLKLMMQIGYLKLLAGHGECLVWATGPSCHCPAGRHADNPDICSALQKNSCCRSWRGHQISDRCSNYIISSRTAIGACWGGGWTKQGKADVQAFCERENLPFVALFRYHDIIDNHSLCYVGMLGLVWRHTSPRQSKMQM